MFPVWENEEVEASEAENAQNSQIKEMLGPLSSHHLLILSVSDSYLMYIPSKYLW